MSNNCEKMNHEFKEITIFRNNILYNEDNVSMYCYTSSNVVTYIHKSFTTLYSFM